MFNILIYSFYYFLNFIIKEIDNIIIILKHLLKAINMKLSKEKTLFNYFNRF